MKDHRQTILIVEDDEAIVLGLRANLEFSGFEVLTATDGPSGLRAARERRPDLVLLDIMLPGLSGYEVCRELRAAGERIPVIMLTARQEQFDKLHGFEVGADDYMTKPFSVPELLARIRAVLNRVQGGSPSVRQHLFGDFVLDLESRVLTRAGAEIPLTRTEFDLLAYFCRNEGKALSRERVMNDVWGMKYLGTQRSLDSFVATLRGKIESDPPHPVHILTVHGVGYKFFSQGGPDGAAGDGGTQHPRTRRSPRDG